MSSNNNVKQEVSNFRKMTQDEMKKNLLEEYKSFIKPIESLNPQDLVETIQDVFVKCE